MDKIPLFAHFLFQSRLILISDRKAPYLSGQICAILRCRPCPGDSPRCGRCLVLRKFVLEIYCYFLSDISIKKVPGRKTDVSDAEWIAELLQHGLLNASFIPDKARRELRELVGYRKSLTKEQAAKLNRLQKMLEGANIKLSGTVKKINGASGRNLLEALLSGEKIDLAKLVEMRDKKLIANNLEASDEQLADALKGNALLRSTLVVCAHSAVKNKSSYFYAQFQRISAHRGKKRAYVAVAHSMLIAIHHILKDGGCKKSPRKTIAAASKKEAAAIVL